MNDSCKDVVTDYNEWCYENDGHGTEEINTNDAGPDGELRWRKDVPMRIKKGLLLSIILLAMASMVHAEVDARVVQTLQLSATPLDMAIPGNGRYIYVLTSDAKLKIFEKNGKLRDTLVMDPGVDHIKPGPRENQLFLINTAGNRIQEFDLDFIQEIPIDGSPTMGSLDAPVVVAVYTDFQ